MAITPIGTLYTTSSTGGTSALPGFGGNIGDILLITTHIASATVHIASIATVEGFTSTALTGVTITHLGGGVFGTHSVDLWLGVVTNANSAEDMQFNFTGSASITSTVNSYTVQGFTAGGQGTTWAVDAALATSTNAASTTITYPTLTPSGAGELYFGYGISGSALTTGQTAGYTAVTDPTPVNAIIYDTGVTGVQSPTSTQTSSATSMGIGVILSATPAPITAIQTSGSGSQSFTESNGTAISTLAVSPTLLGDLMVVYGEVHSATIHYTTLSGGGVATWTPIVGPFVGTSGAYSMNMWMGVVTATGSSTITAATSASISGLTTGLASVEFTLHNSGAIWALDTTGTQSNSASTTIAFPSLTPAATGELYVGMVVSNTGVSGFGQSANLTSAFAWNFTVNGAVFNPQVGTGAYAPTLTQTSGISWTIAAFIKGTLPSGTPRLQILTQAVKRSRYF